MTLKQVKTKVILYQCARCNWIVWGPINSAPRCDKCDSYQTVSVKAGQNGKADPPALEVEQLVLE